MCLLFVKPATAPDLTAEQVIDFHRKNSDGFGVMYASEGLLHTRKAIDTAEKWADFYLEYQELGKKLGATMAFHLRMKTHGQIDLTNTHPYPVVGFDGDDSPMPIAMMHNGVLKTGNADDLTKSDTWHYIQNYIRVLAKSDPRIVFTDAFRELISAHIGSGNKFVFMNHLGEVQIVNKSSGKTWNDIWFSNTYAWNPSNDVLYPGAMPKVTHGGAYWDNVNMKRWSSYFDEEDARELNPSKSGRNVDSQSKSLAPTGQKVLPFEGDKITPAVKMSPVISNKKMTRGERKASIRKMRDTESKRNHEISQFIWTDDDYDYVVGILAEPQFAAAAKVITDPQIVTMLTMFGYQRTFFLLEDFIEGNITIEEVIDCFRDHRKASAFFRLRSYATAN